MRGVGERKMTSSHPLHFLSPPLWPGCSGNIPGSPHPSSWIPWTGGGGKICSPQLLSSLTSLQLSPAVFSFPSALSSIQYFGLYNQLRCLMAQLIGPHCWLLWWCSQTFCSLNWNKRESEVGGDSMGRVGRLKLEYFNNLSWLKVHFKLLFPTLSLGK